MSMICYLLRLSPNLIAQIGNDAELLSGVTRSASEYVWNARLKKLPPQNQGAQERKRAEFQAGLAQMPQFAEQMQAAEKAKARTATLDVPNALCLDKDWHILHFLFTGDAGPIASPSSALLVGEELGDDAGYGPARWLNPAATKAFAAFLDSQRIDALQDRVDLERMSRAPVYSLPDARETESAGWIKDAVALRFPELLDYVVRAAVADEGLLTWFS